MQTIQKIYDFRCTVGRLAVNNVMAYFAVTRPELVTIEQRAKHIEELLAPGAKLPFLYARVEMVGDRVRSR